MPLDDGRVVAERDGVGAGVVAANAGRADGHARDAAGGVDGDDRGVVRGDHHAGGLALRALGEGGHVGGDKAGAAGGPAEDLRLGVGVAGGRAGGGGAGSLGHLGVALGVGGDHVDVLGELELRLAHAVARAVVGAGRAAAALAGVPVKAVALARLAVAEPLAGALELLGVRVGGRGPAEAPRDAEGAGPEAAVGAGPGEDQLGVRGDGGPARGGVGAHVGVHLGALAAGVARARVLDQGALGRVVAQHVPGGVHDGGADERIARRVLVEHHLVVVAPAVAGARVGALGQGRGRQEGDEEGGGLHGGAVVLLLLL